VLVSIPRELRGASLGAAHAWVREQMAYSNPRPSMGDYTLRDSSGKRVSLSALVKGELSEVDIVGADELDAVRANPAHPMSLMSTSPLPAIMYQQNLPRVFGGVITPALWARAKDEYGLFGAAQRLSILLSRPSPLEGHNNYSPRTLALLDARLGTSEQPMHRFVRSNPKSGEVRGAVRGIGIGSYERATNIMNKTNMLGAEATQNIELVRALVDDYLDVAEVGMKEDEDGALLSMAGKMSMQFENSKALFDNFATNVLAPYLISSTANIYAIEYINEYIMPATRLIIENTGKSNKDAMLRKLDSYYKHMVKSLATSPADFYAGKEMALVAHPAFLFKRAGLVLLPIPRSRTDRTFYTMSQVGQPLTYTESGFVSKTDMPRGMKPIVRAIEKGELRQMRVREGEDYKPRNMEMATYFAKSTLDTIYKAVDALRTKVELEGPEGTGAYNLLLSETRRMSQKKLEDLYKDIEGMPAFFYMDLPGIRPIPTNWPQPLIYAMMETLGANRDRLTGLNKEFKGEDFLKPDGIHLDMDEVDADEEIPILKAAIRAYDAAASGRAASQVIQAAKKVKDKYGIMYGTITEDVLKDEGTADDKMAKATTISDQFNDWLSKLESSGLLKSNKTISVATKDYGEAPSIYKIVLDMVHRSVTYYNYEPTRDEVWFTITLLYYCLRHMSLDEEVTTSFFGGLTKLMNEARNKDLEDWLKKVETYGKAPEGVAFDDDVLARYVALKYARDALDDPDSESYRAIFGMEAVRANPGPIFTGPEMSKVKASLDKTIREYEQALHAKYKSDVAEKSYNYLKEYFGPAMSEKVREGAGLAVFIGDEVIDKEVTATLTIDKMYIKVYDFLTKAWETVSEIMEAIASKDMEKLYDKTMELNNHLENAQIIVNQHEMLGGFAGLLDKTSDYKTQQYAQKASDTFALIAEDLNNLMYGEETPRFKAEAEKLKPYVGAPPYKKRYPATLVSALIGFVKETKDLVDNYESPAGGVHSSIPKSKHSGAKFSLDNHIKLGTVEYKKLAKKLSASVHSEEKYAKKMTRAEMDALAVSLLTYDPATVASVLKSAGTPIYSEIIPKIHMPLTSVLERQLKEKADESLKVSLGDRAKAGLGSLITTASEGFSAVAGEYKGRREAQSATAFTIEKAKREKKAADIRDAAAARDKRAAEFERGAAFMAQQSATAREKAAEQRAAAADQERTAAWKEARAAKERAAAADSERLAAWNKKEEARNLARAAKLEQKAAEADAATATLRENIARKEAAEATSQAERDFKLAEAAAARDYAEAAKRDAATAERIAKREIYESQLTDELIEEAGRLAERNQRRAELEKLRRTGERRRREAYATKQANKLREARLKGLKLETDSVAQMSAAADLRRYTAETDASAATLEEKQAEALARAEQFYAEAASFGTIGDAKTDLAEEIRLRQGELDLIKASYNATNRESDKRELKRQGREVEAQILSLTQELLALSEV